jgi:hypothetical protein
MGGKPGLLRTMTVEQFENGYWYAADLKEFSESLGLPSASKLRKDELEKAILGFLRTGKLKTPTRRKLLTTGPRDVDLGLSLDLRIVNYTSNKETKAFIVTEALKMAPGLKRKSGARYRLNRWREKQLTQGKEITYRDLVKQYVTLNQGRERFPQIPHGRYINFLSDFLAAQKGATKEQAIKAWHKLKGLDIPKTYRAWVSHRLKR